MSAAMVGDGLLTRGMFVLGPDAIPPAVGCRSCGRWHYPDRIEVHVDPVRDAAEGTGPDLTLVCPRCQARGPLQCGGPLDPIASGIVAELSQRARTAPTNGRPHEYD